MQRIISCHCNKSERESAGSVDMGLSAVVSIERTNLLYGGHNASSAPYRGSLSIRSGVLTPFLSCVAAYRFKTSLKRGASFDDSVRFGGVRGMVVQIKAMTAGAQDVAGHRSSMSHPSRPSAGSLSTLSFSSTGARVSWPTLPAALLISYASTLPARLTHNPNSRHSLPDQWSQDHEQNGRREQKQPTESVRGRKEELACYHFH